ncbi:MAG: class I SAM-dependent methyltransferase [Pseudomonadales bacterium]
MKLDIDPDSVKGFLHPEEGELLYRLARQSAGLGPVLEVGSYCGRSTLYLGSACREAGGVLYAVDHHRGSEEHQPGEAYHDPELRDPFTGGLDSLPAFRQTLWRAGLSETVIPIVAGTELAGRHWRTPLAMVFIDGGHSEAAALRDYRTWSPHILPGGILAIHDLFEDPAQGGQAPIRIYRLAEASGLFRTLASTHTLGVLERL